MWLRKARSTWSDAKHPAGLFLLDQLRWQTDFAAGAFGESPSKDDLEAISIIETETDADFLDHFEGETDTEVVAPEKSLSFLPGGVAYLRKGEPGKICAE